MTTAMSGFVRVNCGLGDPIEIPEGKAPKEILRSNDNKFIGYYGITRTATNPNRIRKHTGYDYKANEGTPVLAVGKGNIVRVRFGVLGPKPISCPFKYKILSKETQETQELIQKIQDELLFPSKNSRLILAHNTDTKKSEIATEIVNSRIRNQLIEKIKKHEELEKAEKENLLKGKPNVEHIKKKLNSRFSGVYNCQKCPKKESCFGVQVWLKLSNNTYVYYAHLSDLNDSIMSKLADIMAIKLLAAYKQMKHNVLRPNSNENDSLMFGLNLELMLEKILENVDNTFDFSVPIEVETGDIIGESGCTGNAWNMDKNNEHLHFECRKSKNTIPETNTQTSPNIVVKTQFYLQPNTYYVLKILNEITEEDLGITEASVKNNKKYKKEYDANWEKITNKEFTNYKPKWDADEADKTIQKNNWDKHLENFFEKNNLRKKLKELEKELKELEKEKDPLSVEISKKKKGLKKLKKLEEIQLKNKEIAEKEKERESIKADKKEWKKLLEDRRNLIEKIKYNIFSTEYPKFKLHHELIKFPEPQNGDIVAQLNLNFK